jgi:hypothetical protein
MITAKALWDWEVAATASSESGWVLLHLTWVAPFSSPWYRDYFGRRQLGTGFFKRFINGQEDRPVSKNRQEGWVFTDQPIPESKANYPGMDKTKNRRQERCLRFSNRLPNIGY